MTGPIAKPFEQCLDRSRRFVGRGAVAAFGLDDRQIAQGLGHALLVAQFLAHRCRARVLLGSGIKLPQTFIANADRVVCFCGGSIVAGTCVEHKGTDQIVIDGGLGVALLDRAATEQEPRTRILVIGLSPIL